jgi:lipopolysaccharide biosynthesis glycosyltransferase
MTVHLAIAFDQNYLRSFHALLESIIANAGDVHLHLIATGIDDERLENISAYAAGKDIQTRFYNIQDTRMNSFVTRDTWTTAVYYRLYFPLLIDGSVERLLYIDTDTIVLKKLDELYGQSLYGFPVAAVYDNFVKVQPLIGLNLPGHYFNSGVLLIDLAKWRQQQVSERAIEYLRSHPEKIRYVDQCALNAVLKNNWLMLESRYNLLYTYLPKDPSAVNISTALADAVIVHYNLERPWLMLCKNRLRTLFRKYLKASPEYEGQILTDFSLRKIPAWIHIRLIEFYIDQEWLKHTWRKVKDKLR